MAEETPQLQICFQIYRNVMFFIVGCVTLNNLARARCDQPPKAYRRLISITSSLLSLEAGFPVPVKTPDDPGLVGLTLPFMYLSRWLSACVPRNKCEGLQQDGLSHLWQINSLESRYPKHMAKTNRCARRCDLRNFTFPYPFLSFRANQFQHSLSSAISTFFQKRDFSASDNLKNLTVRRTTARGLLDSIIGSIWLGLECLAVHLTSPTLDNSYLVRVRGQV